MLEAIRKTGVQCKFYQASSSELYGKVVEVPQRETTPFHPRSPYAVAKAYAYYITQNYREAYGIFAVNGILFNHESRAPRGDLRHPQDHPRRRAHRARASEGALPRQPRRQARLGLRARLRRRHVAHAPGTTCPTTSSSAPGRPTRCGSSSRWPSRTRGLDWQEHVKLDPRYLRPAEVDLLLADPAKAKEKLGWTPTVGFRELVTMMVDSRRRARRPREARERLMHP
jgi:GDPmannose 4,6-dehydratase